MEIIWHGTKRDGLYYIDDVAPRRVHQVSLHDKKDIGVIIHLLGETNSNQSEEHIWFEIKMGEGTTTTDDEIGTEISFLA
ncbi:unnamed protein product [Prunus armeniaca]